MTEKGTPERMIVWINQMLEERGWSARQASLRAGLGHCGISSILSGVRPGLKRCRALARLFGYPEDFVLWLAGHRDSYPSSFDQASPRIQMLLERTARLPRDRQEKIINIMLLLIEMNEAAIHEAPTFALLPEFTEADEPDDRPVGEARPRRRTRARRAREEARGEPRVRDTR